jgi:hypothetical protein
MNNRLRMLVVRLLTRVLIVLWLRRRLTSRVLIVLHLRRVLLRRWIVSRWIGRIWRRRRISHVLCSSRMPLMLAEDD